MQLRCMNIAIIGCGAIGTTLAKAIEHIKEIKRVYIFDRKGICKRVINKLKKAIVVNHFKEIISKVDLVIESASQDAVKEYGEFVLTHKKNFMIMSVGALLDKKLKNKLVKFAKKNHCKIYIPSGAVCGIDGVKSASIEKIDEILLITKKPTTALIDNEYLKKKIDVKNIKKETVVFYGSGENAVKLFPQNINVAGTLILASEKNVKVKLILSPNLKRNIHTIILKGKFGEIICKSKNNPFKFNPKTSYLSALSAIATLKRIISPLEIGT